MDAWERTLNVLDELVHVNLSDLDDPARVEDLMFDKSFNRSKDYLVALQTLRIVDEWIDEVLPSMEVLQENAQLEQDGFYQPGISESIDAADKWIKRQAGLVQRRVRKKTEEIKSLRDGLFNATALREATKAAKLNQAIYVFTIVTLVFTPLGFLATWWALPFLNEPADESGKVPKPSGFLSSFIVMPLLTSAVAVGLARHTGQESHHDTGQIKAMWDKLLQSVQHLWDRRPQLPEREKTVRSRSLSLGC